MNKDSHPVFLGQMDIKKLGPDYRRIGNADFGNPVQKIFTLLLRGSFKKLKGDVGILLMIVR